MTIDYKKIQIPRNYVLVFPEKEYTNFHIDGRESLPAGKVHLENEAEHYSIRGKVFGIPEELVFNLDRIRANKIPEANGLDFEQTMFYFKTHQVETEGYKQGSVAFDVPMQVSVGDTVYFNYQEHYNAYDHGRWMVTDLGDMFLMKYDQLLCCHPDGNPAAVKMLNGLVLVEPISVEAIFGANVIRRKGFEIAKKVGTEMDFKKKMNVGYVRHWGTAVKDYIDLPDNRDQPYEFTQGQIVLYNPRVAPALEFSLHKTLFAGMHLVKLRRRNIFAIMAPDVSEGDVMELVTTINLN